MISRLTKSNPYSREVPQIHPICSRLQRGIGEAISATLNAATQLILHRKRGVGGILCPRLAQ